MSLLRYIVAALRALDNEFSGRLRALYFTSACIEECVLNADLVIGAVLIPGATAPKLVSRHFIARMSAGSVVVDVVIDQGGCLETSRPITHQNPTYTENFVIHYCVANMPSGASHTATVAPTNATLPFVLEMANIGVKEALQPDDSLAARVNVCAGSIVHPDVAAS